MVTVAARELLGGWARPRVRAFVRVMTARATSELLSTGILRANVSCVFVVDVPVPLWRYFAWRRARQAFASALSLVITDRVVLRALAW